MKRVLVIGSAGAGKSTFARKLGEKTGLEVIHLDKLYWKPNWVETTDKVEWRRILAEILKGESWIIDGNYGNTMEMRLAASDTAILLDFPRYVCIWRALRRVVIYRNRARPDMAEGCHERFDWEFLKWIWNYPRRSKPKVEALLARFENEKTIIRLKSSREIEKFFADHFSNRVESSEI
jgi:adenylate kinase family enzyme